MEKQMEGLRRLQEKTSITYETGMLLELINRITSNTKKLRETKIPKEELTDFLKSLKTDMEILNQVSARGKKFLSRIRS